MAKQTATTEVKATHTDLIKDNGINVAELPKGTQELISKFSAITDPESKKAMDEKIYAQVEEFAKKKKEAEGKQKPAGTIDVSSVGTAKTKEQIDAEEKAKASATAGNPPPQSKSFNPLSYILGKK